MKVADHVRGTSSFVCFRGGYLYYVTSDTGLEFPVPVDDVSGATLNATEKSLLMMRWVRKHIATLTTGVTETV